MSDQTARPAPRNEVRGAADVVAEAVEIVSRPVQSTHASISGAVFAGLRRAGLGSVSGPVQRVHDGVTAGVYAAVRGVGHLASRGTGTAAVLARGDDWRPITGRPAGAVVAGAVNGLLGDRMAAAGNDLAVEMRLFTASLSHGHGELPLDAIAEAVDDHPDRDLGHVVLFVHGLGETEHAWRLADQQSAGEGYAERIASTVGAVPLLLRYNSGLPLAANGAALSALLTATAARWPVPIRRLDLVGHSMGGLVLRHACHAAVGDGAAWVRSVRRMVYLGSPHQGAPLAHGVDRLATRLAGSAGDRARRSSSLGRPWAEFLDRRSAGIRDLVAGVSDAEVPLLAGASHHAVAACLTASEHHPLATVLGDLLVPVDSARGAVADVETLPSSHHFHLLNDPAVHDHLLRWLAADPEPVAALEPGSR